MPKPSPTRYRTTSWADYNAALRKRSSLSVWFDPEMVWQVVSLIARPPKSKSA